MNAIRVVTPTRSRPNHPGLWRQTARGTWRLHRGALLVLLGGVCILSVIALLVGLRAHAVYSPSLSCGSVGAAALRACSERINFFGQKPWGLYPPTFGLVVLALPLAVGTFLGAPLIASELERGTFRFTWTQGIGRKRWTIINLLLLATATLVATGILGALFTWSYQPYVGAGVTSGWDAVPFEVTPVTLAAWAVLALSLGVLVGTATKRVVPAMAATLVAMSALLGLTWWKLGNLLLGYAPLTTRTAPFWVTSAAGPYGPIGAYAPPGSGQIAGGWLVSGRFAGSNGGPLSRTAVYYMNAHLPGNAAGQLRWLSQHHEAFVVTYQPASRFWIFQGAEGMVLLGLATLLALGTILLISRRA